MKPILSFNRATNTIRQEPENYLIAHFDTNHQNWICEPDLAADRELCIRVFTALLEFDNKYQKDGLKLLAVVTPNSEFENEIEDPFLKLNYHIVITSDIENIITVRRLSDNDEFNINQKTKSGLIKKFVKDENASGGLYALMDSGSQVAINCIVL